MKHPFIVGNWKLNGSKSMISDLLFILKTNLVDIKKCCVAIAPPVMYLDMVRGYLLDSNIKLCAQNVDINLFGSFTGDISAEMLKDFNTKYVLVGHSERRIYHKESDLCIAKKIAVLKKTGLIPIICIGENKEAHDAGLSKLVCVNQINTIIKLLGNVHVLKNSVIAYEPVWAIGSGISAIPTQAQEIHECIRECIAEYDKTIAAEIFIQYGGSVNAENVVNFLCQKDIDGVLVGSCSLDADNFIKIIKFAEGYGNSRC